MPRNTSRSLPLALAAAAAACATVVPTAAPASRGNVPVPATGLYFGAYVDLDGSWQSTPVAIRRTAEFERRIARRLQVDNHFYGWKQPFPTALERDDRQRGRIPMITWKGTRLDRILSGAEDGLIAARAHDVRVFGSPVFIRWGWEMNGGWTEWSGPGNNTPGAHDGPKKYAAAWRRIHDIFTRHGATNVSWVWAPNGTSVPRQAWNAVARYYPGDAYVDWVGFSAYNWGTTREWSRWSSFSALVRGFHRKWAGRKPLMVAETAVARRGGSQAAWVRGIERALPRYPGIKAVLFFEQPPSWTVLSSPATLAAFRSLVASRLFSRIG